MMARIHKIFDKKLKKGKKCVVDILNSANKIKITNNDGDEWAKKNDVKSHDLKTK